MFEKLLSSIGIGGAKVNTVLKQEKLQPGKTLHGKVMIYGGKVAQPITGITLVLKITYYRDADHSEQHHITVPLAKKVVADLAIIKPGESEVIPFDMQVPYNTPITTDEQTVFLETIVHIPNAVNPSDIDPVEVYQPVLTETIKKIEALGFYPTKPFGRCYEGDKEGALKQLFPFLNHHQHTSINTLTLRFQPEPTSISLQLKVNETEHYRLIVDYQHGIDKDEFRRIFKHYEV